MQIKYFNGFTLVELMITIAIIGIIAAWAVPSYQEFIMVSHRSDAKSALLKLQLEQEKWRASHITYATLSELGMANTTANEYYNLTIKNTPDGEQFLALASPMGSQKNDPCGTFAINQLGAVYERYADQNCWGQ